MTEEQVRNLNLGFTSVDARTVLMVESAIEWVNTNTTLNLSLGDQATGLPASVKLFINKYVEIMDRSAGVSSESVGGLSQSFDEIIEIAACKVYQGGIIDTFETFVNPKMPIPAKITELTSIDDEMVKDALTIDEVLPKFMEFCQGSIMVAHNAKFDIQPFFCGRLPYFVYIFST